jgi:hypothetical protein
MFFSDVAVVHDYNVEHCPCITCPSSLPAILVRSGYFPCTPKRCKTAFSFEILESYLTMSVQSSFSPAVFRLALISGLQQRQFALNSTDPWKNQLPDALLWFDALKRYIDVEFAKVLDDTEQQLFQATNGPCSLPRDGKVAAYILRKWCSWCFGRRTWGGNPERYVTL